MRWRTAALQNWRARGGRGTHAGGSRSQHSLTSVSRRRAVICRVSCERFSLFEIRSTGPRPGDAHPFRRSGQLAPVAGDAPGASTPPRRREPGR